MESVSETFNIDLRRLGVLRELQRRGSLTKTAQALHLTSSAVSQQIAVLAKETGVPLTERDGRGIRLTGQARLLLEHADLIAAQLERARAELTAFDQGRRGTATIGAFSSAILGLLPGALSAIAGRQPGVRIDVVEAEAPDMFTALDAGEIDVAIAVDFAAAPPHTDRRYTRTDLLIDALDLALPSSHRYAHLDEVPLRELASDAWIVADPNTCCGAVTRSVCAAAGFTPDIRHAINDWAAVAALVGAGAGVALIPRLIQPLQQADLVLRTPSANGPAPFRSIFAAVRAGSENDPVLAAVVEQLRQAAQAAAARAASLRTTGR